MGPNQTYKHSYSKGNHKQKDTLQPERRICANDTISTGLTSNTHNQLIQPNDKNTQPDGKMGKT